MIFCPPQTATRLKHEILKYELFEDIPLDLIDEKKYSIYIIDYDWNYLHANPHSIKQSGLNPTGKNIRTVWGEHPSINFAPVYNLLKENVAQKKAFEIKSRSPLTRKAIEIVGRPLANCYYFSVYELPDKESLLKELKSLLKRPRQSE